MCLGFRPTKDDPDEYLREMDLVLENETTQLGLAVASVTMPVCYLALGSYFHLMSLVTVGILVNLILHLPLLVWVAMVVVGVVLLMLIVFVDPGVVKPHHVDHMTTTWRWCQTCCFPVPRDA